MDRDASYPYPPTSTWTLSANALAAARDIVSGGGETYDEPDLPSDKKTQRALFALEYLALDDGRNLNDRAWSRIFQYELADWDNAGYAWEQILRIRSDYMLSLIFRGLQQPGRRSDDPYCAVLERDIEHEIQEHLRSRRLIPT